MRQNIKRLLPLYGHIRKYLLTYVIDRMTDFDLLGVTVVDPSVGIWCQ